MNRDMAPRLSEKVFTDGKREHGSRDILLALRECGVRNGDAIFVHSDLRSIGKILPGVSREILLGSFVEALRQAVGEEGTVILPTFSYSFCNGEVFDPDETPSTVGVLTEYFRKLPKVRRSRDAIFSVAAVGKDAEYYTDVGTHCFGEHSVFEKLFQKDSLLVFIGERFDITYMHFIEQRVEVPYRFIKNFPGKIRNADGSFSEYVFEYNVRPLDQGIEYNLEGIASFLDAEGVLRTSPLSSSKIRSVRAKNALECLTAGLKKDPYLLLSHPPIKI